MEIFQHSIRNPKSTPQTLIIWHTPEFPLRMPIHLPRSLLLHAIPLSLEGILGEQLWKVEYWMDSLQPWLLPTAVQSPKCFLRTATTLLVSENGILAGIGHILKMPKQTGCGFLTPYQEWSYGQRIRLFYGIPASLGTAPHVYVENDKVTALPNRTIGPQKGIKLIRNGVAGADFEPQDCLPNIIRHGIDYINKQRDSKKPFFLYLPITAPHTPVLPAKNIKVRQS